MAYYTPQLDARDANLEKLRTAVEEWYKKEKERLEEEVQFLRAVQEGRGSTGVEALLLGKMKDLTMVEVQAFFGESPKGE
jgi:hypothetical protein